MSIKYANSLGEVGAVTKGVVPEAVPAMAAFSGEPMVASNDWIRDTRYEWYDDYSDETVSVVNNEKKITLGKGQINLGQEENSQFIQFEMPKRYDGFDLSTTHISFHFNNVKGEHGSDPAVNVEYSEIENKIRFGWLIDGDVTKVPGKIRFSIHADGVNSKGHAYRWKTRDCDAITVEEDLCIECDNIQLDDSWVQELVDKVAETIVDKIAEVQLAEQVESANQSAADAYNYAEQAHGFANDAANAAGQAVDAKLADYATQEFVRSEVAAVDVSEQLKEYALSEDIPKNVSELTNDAGYLTEHQSLEAYALKEEIPSLEAYALKEELPKIDGLASEDFVREAVAAVDVSGQLVEYAKTEDIKTMFDEKLGEIVSISQEVDETTGELVEVKTPIPVKEYIDAAIQSVDVQEQLVGLAKEEYVEDRIGNLGETVVPGEGDNGENIVVKKTVKQYVDEKTGNINLEGYATIEALEAVNNNTAVNAGNIAAVNKNISDLQSSLAALEGDNKNLIIQYDEVGSLLHLYEKSENGDITITDGDKEFKVKELYSTVITGAGGGGTALVSTVKLSLRPDGEASSTILHGTETELNYALSTRKARESQDESGNDVTIYEEAIIAGDITFTLYRDNVYMTHFTVTKSSPEIQNGSVDVSDYIKLGKQVFTLTASYNEQLGADGESITVRSSAEWSVNSVRLEIVDLPDDIWESTPKYGSTTFSYTPVGALDKNIYFEIDGGEPEVKFDPLNGHTYTYTIPQLSHGVHTLKVWCEGDVGGTTISTEPRKYVLMFVEAGNTEPIIRIKAPDSLEQYSSDYIYYNVLDPINEIIKSVTIYDEKDTVLSSVENITSAEQKWEFRPSTVEDKTIIIQYKDTRESVTVKVTKFPYEINSVTNGLVVDFSPIGRTNSDADYNVFKNGAYTVEKNAETGEETKVEIPMTWSFSDNFDWINGGWKTDSNGEAYFCIKAGTSVDFNYNLFGTEGVVAKQDANREYTVAGTGKEFKLVFKTTNVARANATWLKCLDVADKKDLGLRMEAQNAYIDSSLGTLEVPYADNDVIEFDMNIVPMTKFTENGQPDLTVKTIPMVITYEDGTPVQPKVISSASVNFKQDTPRPITIGSDYCDVCIYRMKVYDRYLEDKEVISNFIADARTGTEMARRYLKNDIYPIEDKQRITPESVAAACPDLKVYVLSAPYFTNDKGDKVEHTIIRQIHNTGTKEKPEYDASENWTAVDAIHNGQGTSSNEYGYSGRNLEFNLKKATITLNDNVTVVKNIQLSPTSYPTNYLNFKANIASSEHANNALLQKRYDRYLPYTTLASLLDERKKGTMEFFNCVVFIQETNEDIESHREFSDTDIHFYSIGNIGDSKKTDATRVNDPDDTNEFCVEIMDWNRYLSSFPEDTKVPTRYIDKGEEVLRFEEFLVDENLGENGILYDKDEHGNYVHSMDATVDKSKTYYVDILEADDFSEDYTYGFRYVQTEYDKKEYPNYKELNAEFQKPLREKWIEFYRFMTRDLTTNGVEDAAKVAAWKLELSNWFVLDAVLYYYLYTLRYTMVDNRAKNTFWHWGKHYITLAEALEKGIAVYDADKNQIVDASTTITRFYDVNGNEITNINATAAAINGGYRMDFWDYDNDTALGIDNAGKLEIPFGVEDEDTDPAGVPYFRAHDSVVFARIAKYFVDELENMWHTTEINPVGKAFDSHSFISEFDAWQEQFPEELWRLDYERKYKRTYVGGTGSEWDNARKQSNKSEITSDRFLTEMMNGRKKYQRRCFERNQEIYMSSKFKGEVNIGDTITLRGVGQVSAEGKPVEPNFALTVVPFSKMYINLYNATDSIYYHKKCEAGVPCGPIPYPTTNLDFIYVRGASQMQSLGNLSPMYLQTAELTAGAKLKEVLLGNETVGYSNDSFKTLAIGAGNKLLEELDIRNLSNLNNTVLPVTNIPSLKRVYAQGSNISEAAFANNGLLEEAYLPGSITRLELRNLHYLKAISLESYENLLHLVAIGCSDEMNGVILDMINQAVDLQTLRLSGMNWNLENTAILERLYRLIKTPETPEVSLAGKVYVPMINEKDYENYTTAWPELQITYGEDGLIPQFRVLFLNADGKVFEEQWVVKGEDAIDPVSEGRVPMMESSQSHDYEFSGWEGSLLNIFDDRVITAVYNETLRKYTITYAIVNNGLIVKTLQETEALYGSYVPYTKEIPVDTSNESGYKFRLFKEWDKSGFVNGNKVIAAVFDEYTYKNDLEGKGLENMSPVEIYAMTKLAEPQLNKVKISDCVEAGDSIKIPVGNDYCYEDWDGENKITSQVIINEKTLFDGTNYLDTGIKLFEEDKDFVLALEYKPLEGNANNAVIAECMGSGGSRGFQLYQSNSTDTTFVWGNGNDEGKPYSDVVTSVVSGIRFREIIVLKHEKGDNNIKIFKSAFSSETSAPMVVPLYSSKSPKNSSTLMLGCAQPEKGSYASYAKANIYWCKLWEAALPDDVCIELAQWPHEEMEMLLTDEVNNRRYYLASDSEKRTSLTFVAANTLSNEFRWNANNSIVGGFGKSTLNKILNGRLYNALPMQIKALIKQAKINTIADSATGTVEEVNSYITIPALSELMVGSENTSLGTIGAFKPYLGELSRYASTFSIMTDNTSRIRYNEDGLIKDYWLRTLHMGYSYPLHISASEGDAGGVWSYKYPNNFKGIIIVFSF